MRAVYVDTGAWIALAYRRDRAHRTIRDHFAALRARGDLLVTSDPAVGETITRLRYDAGLVAALAFRRILQQAVDLQTLRIRDTDASLPEAGPGADGAVRRSPTLVRGLRGSRGG